MSELLTLLEASRLLGVDSAEVIRMIYRGQLEGVVVEGHLKVPADQEPLKKQTQGACEPRPLFGMGSRPESPAQP
ncbi:MAG: hypothetical protein WD080_07675 [Egibacteraceae bacterium]